MPRNSANKDDLLVRNYLLCGQQWYMRCALVALVYIEKILTDRTFFVVVVPTGGDTEEGIEVLLTDDTR